MNEYDKLACIFCENIGKVNVAVKGAQRSRSKFLSSTQNFCFGEYILFRGKSMYSMNDNAIIDSFNVFLDNIETIAYASYFCELIDISMAEEEANDALFKNLVSAFYFLKNKAVNPALLCCAFEVKLLKFTGYELNLDNCCICRKKISTSNFFSLQYYGGVCSECSKVNTVPIRSSSYNILKYIVKSPIENICRLTISKENIDELQKLLFDIISNIYYKVPKSLEILKYI